MQHEIDFLRLPKADNGLTLPLTRSLDSSSLAKHQARVALELEVLAKKLDRFGWDRDRGTPAHDRMMNDWIDALQDYPLDEIRQAISAAMDERRGRMPNERDILFQIMKARERFLIRSRLPAPVENVNPPPTVEEKARINALLASVGFIPKRMKEDDA